MHGSGLREQRFNGRIVLFLLFSLLQNAAENEHIHQHRRHKNHNEPISPLHAHVLADQSNEILHDLRDDHVKQQDHAGAFRHVSLEQKHGDGEKGGEQGRHERSCRNQNDGSLFSEAEAQDIEKNPKGKFSFFQCEAPPVFFSPI